MRAGQDTRALEALFFVSDEPITASVLAQALDVDRRTVEALCERLARELEDRGFGPGPAQHRRRVAPVHPSGYRAGRRAVRPVLAPGAPHEGVARDAVDRRVQAARHPAPDLRDPRRELRRRPAGADRPRADRGGRPRGDARSAGALRDDPGTGESKNETKALDAGGWGKSGGGYWSYPHGHLCLWTWAANPQDRPLWDKLDELKAAHGDAKGEFMVKGSRNLCLYPNVYVMDQFSTQIRHFRPIAPDKTEVTIYCIAPKGESDEARSHRIRQYEDFFNASGMATPDDLEEFRSCQLTFRAPGRAVERHEPRRPALADRSRQVAESLGMHGVISAGSRTRTRASTPSSTATGWRRCATALAARKATDPHDAPPKRQAGSNQLITQNMIEQFLYREARYLDDREFEKWLECYADDVVYWMPSWDDNDMLVEDPQRDISLIYYANKGGLEDRVFRIRTERSSATSLPEPRTSHNITNVEVIERRGDLVDVRFNWHTMYFRYKTIDPYYGTSFYTIDFSGEQPLIRRKTVVLKNDYIHHVVDVYHF